MFAIELVIPAIPMPLELARATLVRSCLRNKTSRYSQEAEAGQSQCYIERPWLDKQRNKKALKTKQKSCVQ